MVPFVIDSIIRLLWSPYHRDRVRSLLLRAVLRHRHRYRYRRHRHHRGYVDGCVVSLFFSSFFLMKMMAMKPPELYVFPSNPNTSVEPQENHLPRSVESEPCVVRVSILL